MRVLFESESYAPPSHASQAPHTAGTATSQPARPALRGSWGFARRPPALQDCSPPEPLRAAVAAASKKYVINRETIAWAVFAVDPQRPRRSHPGEREACGVAKPKPVCRITYAAFRPVDCPRADGPASPCGCELESNGSSDPQATGTSRPESCTAAATAFVIVPNLRTLACNSSRRRPPTEPPWAGMRLRASRGPSGPPAASPSRGSGGRRAAP